MKKKNQTTRTNRYILIGLSVFCAFMMALSSFSDIAAGPFRVLANITVVPLQQGINHIGGWLGDMKDNFATMEQLQSENSRLREQISDLSTENSYLLEQSYEYERLQELYELDQNYAEYGKTAAHVIGRDSGNWFNTFTIDKGSNDGIEVDMNVLAGSGLAGLYAAYKAAAYGKVALVTKAGITESNSYFAQGGIAAVTDGDDAPALHFEDTVIAGRGLCDYPAVDILVNEGPQRIRELIGAGMHFDMEDGNLALGLEGGHHHPQPDHRRPPGDHEHCPGPGSGVRLRAPDRHICEGLEDLPAGETTFCGQEKGGGLSERYHCFHPVGPDFYAPYVRAHHPGRGWLRILHAGRRGGIRQ